MQDPVQDFRNLLASRLPLHRRWMWIWVGIAPLTAPFAIVPIIPNIPFFFCCWRAWSHWRGKLICPILLVRHSLTCTPAHRGARFLNELLNHNAIVATPHKSLDMFYQALPAVQNGKSTAEQPCEPPSDERTAFLLSRGDIPNLVGALRTLPDDEAPPSRSVAAEGKWAVLATELMRAVDQAVTRSTSPSRS